MKFIFFIFFILIIGISLGFVQAFGFSPGSLEFNFQQNEEQCQIISLNSDSLTINVSDKWAENKDVEWRVGLFDKNASYHEININYDNILSLNKREVEVCLSGNKAGEYHGVLLLREEQKGNSVIQMGVWLKVIINEKVEEPPQESPPQNTGSGSSSSSSGFLGGINFSKETNKSQDTKLNKTNSTDIEEIKEHKKQENNESINNQNIAGITGNVTGNGLIKSNWIVIGVILVVLIIIGVIIHKKRKANEVNL